jgi:hypothetical protein
MHWNQFVPCSKFSLASMNLESRALALAFDCFGLYGRKNENEAGGSWGGKGGKCWRRKNKHTYLQWILHLGHWDRRLAFLHFNLE